MKRNEPGLIYHSLHGRHLRGCMPLALLFSLFVVVGLLFVVKVDMPKRIRPKGVGQVFYRNDGFLHFMLRQRTPLPLNIPAYVDPSRREAAAVVAADGRAEAAIQPAPAFDFLSTPPDSAVLNEDDLLAMPPVREEQPAVTDDAGEEVPE